MRDREQMLVEENSFLKKQNEELRRQVIGFNIQNRDDIKINSENFWETHYRNGGNSGVGSYNKLANFKAEVINKFLEEHNIQTVLELGCGDGNQLNLLKCKQYTGVDVSETIIAKNNEKYKEHTNKKFYLRNQSEYMIQQYDVTLSLDVIFHLLEEEVYSQYMQDLFKLSKKFVIIYSSNHEEITIWPEYRHRRFIKYIQENLLEWQLVNYIPNKYPYIIGKETESSAADFYIFERTN